MLNSFLVNILGSQIYIYTQKHKYFLSISRRKIALPVTYSMSKLRLKLLYTSPQQYLQNSSKFFHAKHHKQKSYFIYIYNANISAFYKEKVAL